MLIESKTNTISGVFVKDKFLSYFILISILFNFINCSNSENLTKTKQIYPNPLTKVLTIGLDESIDEEFLLSSPRSIAVDNNDNIYIVDEDKVKIFDKDGNPKSTFGQNGQGPGEFVRAFGISIGPSGIINVSDQKGMNIFDRNENFLSSTRVFNNNKLNEYLKNENLKLNFASSHIVNRFIPLNNNSIIGQFITRTTGKRDYITSLIYYNTDTIKSILHHEDISNIPGSKGGISGFLGTKGKFSWGLFENSKVVYWKPDYANPKYSENLNYEITIFDIYNENKIETITHPYQLALIPDSLKNRFAESADKLKDWDHRQAAIMIKDYMILDALMKKETYYAPIKQLFIDGQFLHVMTFKSNDKSEFNTDVFDLNNKEYISSYYLPFSPYLISNNFAYKLSRSQKTYSNVQKFRIDPKVFGK